MATNPTPITNSVTASATPSSAKPNILQTIIAHKTLEVAEDKIALPLDSFIANVVPTNRDFLKALTAPGARFILECKKASPSKGLIRTNFDLKEIAGVYGKYADCISVLTDKKFFQGSYDYLRTMRDLVDQPLLHKDFCHRRVSDLPRPRLWRRCRAADVVGAG